VKTGVEGFDGRLENPASKSPRQPETKVPGYQAATTKKWLYNRHKREIQKGNLEAHYQLNIA
jgi:hypothetical protein